MERAVFGILLCSMLAPVYAGQWSLLVNGHAVHLESSSKHKNEANYGLGFQFDLPREDWVYFSFGSEFTDSRGDPSYNFGGGMRKRYFLGGASHFHMDLGGAALLMTRETFKDGEPFPAILPIASVGGDRLSMNVVYVPPVDSRIISLVFFQAMYSLD